MENDRTREQVLKARVARERATARKRGKQRVRFSTAVRQEAVDLAATCGRARDQLALEIGISKTALQRWTALRRSGAAVFRRLEVESTTTDSQVPVILFPSGARLTGLSWEQVCQLLGVSA